VLPRIIRILQVLYVLCLAAVLSYVSQLDHVAFPYWFEHALVASLMTSAAALVGWGFYRANCIEICRLDVIVGASVIAGMAFYVGREVRDHEKLPGAFDYKGLVAPIVAELLIAAGYILFVRQYLHTTTPAPVYAVFLTAFAWLTGLIASKWKMMTQDRANEYKDSLVVFQMVLGVLAAAMLYMIWGLWTTRITAGG
jgi:hypothetical protein